MPYAAAVLTLRTGEYASLDPAARLAPGFATAPPR